MTEIRRSSRAGRGNLMAGLLATEELEKPADDGFWGSEGQGGALWNKMDKELDDKEFGNQKPEEDSEDDDINFREDPNLETEVLGEVLEEKKKPKRNVYVDPKKKKTKAELQEEKEKQERENRRNKRINSEENNKRRKLNSGASRPVTPNPDRKLRQSTLSSTKERKAQMEIEKSKDVGIIKFEDADTTKLTQIQLLEEAKITEHYNTITLERMKRLEAIKKKPVPIRKKITGPKIITLYRPESNYVVFESPLPSLFTEGNIHTH